MFGEFFLGFGRQNQVVTKPLGKALGRFRCETFEVVAHKRPNVADFVQVSLDLDRPAFQSGFAFP